ncbi:MAG TPA: MBL fold metallo-hydrolase [Acidobacteriaceae bacterium]|nr:MBL fold metallo-hydrolase [Acidobacteriaceae bacterium]
MNTEDLPEMSAGQWNSKSRCIGKAWHALALGCALALSGATALAQQAPHTAAGKLHIYFVDVEGGQSTLFVTPGGHSLLIDTGWPDNHGRDADRVVALARRAGLHRIDYVLLTHYHVDHTGGVPNLVARIPVGTFIDHGPDRQTSDPTTEHAYEAYQKVLATGKCHHILAHPGLVLPILGIHVEVLTADGNFIARPLPGAGLPNPYCKVSELRPADQTGNARSTGVMITFGRLRILDLGDLTWDKEMDMMCPNNRIGHVDLLVVSHHDWYQSSGPALVDAVSPRVAVMDNGATKGGSIPTVKTIRAIPGLAAEHQLHCSEEAGAGIPPAEYLANVQGPDTGNYLEVAASRSGNLSVHNPRTGLTRTYAEPSTH